LLFTLLLKYASSEAEENKEEVITVLSAAVLAYIIS
jgi:hypothetical protein